MQIAIQVKRKHLDCCCAGQYIWWVIHSVGGDTVDELPGPDHVDYDAWERNILFLLSLIMNRFAASTRGLPEGMSHEWNIIGW